VGFRVQSASTQLQVPGAGAVSEHFWSWTIAPTQRSGAQGSSHPHSASLEQAAAER